MLFADLISLSHSSNGWWTAPVTLTVTANDATSGVDTLDTNHNGAGWTAYTTPITLSTDGTHSFDARVIDVAGWETVDGLSIPIDTTAPTLHFVFEREPDRNGWYNHSVHVGVETSDATSGVSGTVARLAYEGTWRPYQGAYLIGGDGEHIFEAAVTDIAGHVTARQVTVPIDVTSPTTTLTWDGEALSISATDNRSGVMGTTLTINGIVTPYTGEAIAFEVAGDYRVEVYSTDMAGNDEAVQVLNISYDPDAVNTSMSLTPPTLTGELSCTDGRYDVNGFASASSGLSSIYLLAQAESSESFEVSGARYTYNPASSMVEAIAFYYIPEDEQDYNFTLVAEDTSGGERRLDLDCSSETILVVPETNGESNSSNDYLNQYPPSLGDMTGVSSVPVQEQAEVVNIVSETNNPAPISSNYLAEDTTVTIRQPEALEFNIVEGSSSPLSAQDLATILSMTGLLATTTAAVGLQISETARRREEELEAERLADENQRQLDLAAQAQHARENIEMNAQMRAEAQKEIILEVQQSEANKQYHEYIAGLWAEYYARLDAVQQYRMEQAATAAVYTLPEGSTIADLPQHIQDVFWELGNMSLEYANHHNEDTGDQWYTNVADGEWAFQDQERRNLGYYQYLIREAAKAGDMDAVIDHATKGAEYIGTTLVTRIDRELQFARDEAVRHTRNNQYDAVLDEDLKRLRDRSELERDLSRVTRDGFTHLDEALITRGDELHIEMIHRKKPHLSLAIDLNVISHQIAGSNDILDNLSAQLDRATGVRYRRRIPNEEAFGTDRTEFDRLNDRAQNEDNQMIAQETQLRLLDLYGVDITNADDNDWPTFDENGYEFVANQYEGVRLIGERFVGDPDNPTLHALPNIPGYVLLDPELGTAPLELLFFRRAFGPIEVVWSHETVADKAGETSEPDENGIIRIEYFQPNEDPDYIATPRNVVHEYGHALDWRAGQLGRLRVQNQVFTENGDIAQAGTPYQRHYEGFVENFLSGNLAQNTEPTAGEDWGDSFMAWVYDDFASTEIGDARESVFEQWLGQAIGIAYGVGLGVDTNVVSAFVTENLNVEIQVDSSFIPEIISEVPHPSGQLGIPRFGTIPENTPVNIIGYTDRYRELYGEPPVSYGDRWYLVEYGGVIGWVLNDNFDNVDENRMTNLSPEQVTAITGRSYIINSEGTFPLTVDYDNEGNPIQIQATNYVWLSSPADPTANTQSISED